MPALYLPVHPAPRRMTPRPISSRNEMGPAFGGPDQRESRMGSRYAIDVEMPPMSYAHAQEWADIDDEAATVVMLIDQPGLDIGDPGFSVVVDGGGQTGSAVRLRGLTPNYQFRKNQWVSMILSGQRYCYRASFPAVADGAGKVLLPLRTLLRKPVTDGAVVEVAEPKIEGYPTPTEDCWSIDAFDRLVRPAFAIRERE